MEAQIIMFLCWSIIYQMNKRKNYIVSTFLSQPENSFLFTPKMELLGKQVWAKIWISEIPTTFTDDTGIKRQALIREEWAELLISGCRIPVMYFMVDILEFLLDPSDFGWDSEIL